MANAEMTYFAKLGLNAQEFLNGMKASQASVLAFYRDVSVSMAMTIQIFNQVIAAVQQVGAAAQELKDFSYQTGLTTLQIQKMQYAAVLAGTSFGNVSTSINKMSLSMADAADSSSAAAKAFKDLGVSTDGRSVDEVFDSTARALVNMDDVTRRNADAMAIFGRSYKDLLPYLDTYVSKAEEIEDLDYLTDEQVEDLQKAKMEVDKLGYAWTIVLGNVISYFEQTSDIRNSILYPEGGGGGAKGRKGAAPTESEQAAVQAFTNKWEGLSDVQIEILDLQTKIADETKIMNETLSEAEYDEAARKVQVYTNRLNELYSSMNRLDVEVKKNKNEWAAGSVVGAKGSEMYSFLMAEMAAGTDYETALQKWTQGAPTRLNMEGTLGAEGVTSKADQVADELDAEIGVREDKYAQIEQISLKHWTAEAEMARVAMQEMGDWWAQEVNFINGTVAHAQTITMTDGVANAEPIDFPEAVAPKLQSADFSGIKFTGGANPKTTGTAGSSKSTVDVNIEVKAKDDTEVVATSYYRQGG